MVEFLKYTERCLQDLLSNATPLHTNSPLQ